MITDKDKDLTKLISCKLVNIIKDNVAIPTILAQDGTKVAENLPKQWLYYIKDAINMYYKRDKKIHIVKSNVIFTVKLPHRPLTREEGRTICKHEDGTYTLSANQEYTTRLRYLNKNKKAITKYITKFIPVTYPVIIDCQFHVKKSVKKDYNLAGLLYSTIDILYRLGIIESMGNEIVYSFDGSRINYIETNDECTFITVRRIT